MTRFLLICALLLISIEGFRVWWFHVPATSVDSWNTLPKLTLDTRGLEQNTPLRSFPVADYVDVGYLKFNRAQFFRVQDGEENEPPHGLLFMEYRAGNPSIWNDLFTHPPEVCMRSSGCILEKTIPSRAIELGGRRIPVRCLKYRNPVDGSPLYIFKLIWLPAESPIQPGTDKTEKRNLWVDMALSRSQAPGGAVLLARVQQVEDFETAWKILSEDILRYLQITPSTATP